MKRIAMSIGLLAALLTPACASEKTVLSEVTHDLCNAPLVMLGEKSGHGDAETQAFKAELVLRLIEDCGFDTVIFEASTYEFEDMNEGLQDGRRVTSERLAEGVGGLWNANADLTELFVALADGMNDGTVRVLGMDDQLGGRGQPFSNDTVNRRLSSQLSPDRASVCAESLRRRIYFDYDEEHPRGQAETRRLERCVADMMARSQPGADRRMARAVGRFISRDSLPGAAGFAARDNSMFVGLSESLTESSKTIVWTATIHALRDASMIGPFSETPNLGQLVQTEIPQARVIGFSAASGAEHVLGRGIVELEDAPSDSLEAMALSGDRPVGYLDREALEGLGPRPARLIGEKFIVYDWQQALDGVVVFKEQRAVERP